MRTIAQRIWDGDASAAEEVRLLYRKDPVGQFIPWVSVLYSFRYKRRYAEQLLGLKQELVMRARKLLKTQLPEEREARAKATDGIDVVATVLVWMSTQETNPGEKYSMLDLAINLCEHGGSARREEGAHTPVFLELTRQEARIRRDACMDTTGLLEAMGQAVKIYDPNQRARAFRKISTVLRLHGSRRRAWQWGISACFIPGSSIGTRMKSVVSLFGFT